MDVYQQMTRNTRITAKNRPEVIPEQEVQRIAEEARQIHKGDDESAYLAAMHIFLEKRKLVLSNR